MSDLRGTYRNRLGAELIVEDPAAKEFNVLSSDIWLADTKAELGGLIPARTYLVTEQSLRDAGYERVSGEDES